MPWRENNFIFIVQDSLRRSVPLFSFWDSTKIPCNAFLNFDSADTISLNKNPFRSWKTSSPWSGFYLLILSSRLPFLPSPKVPERSFCNCSCPGPLPPSWRYFGDTSHSPLCYCGLPSDFQVTSIDRVEKTAVPWLSERVSPFLLKWPAPPHLRSLGMIFSYTAPSQVACYMASEP